MGLTKPRAYQIYDLDYKQSVRAVTIANVTLSGGAPSLVDGVSLSLNDRILVTGQSTASQNGIYYVTTVGSGSNGTWLRSIDTNETGELDSGTIVMVAEGNIFADTQWKLITDDPIVIGSSELIFVQNYSANSISSGTSNVVVGSNANVSISVAGTSNVLVVSSTDLNVSGNIIPTANVTYSLGNLTNRFTDVYLANNSIYLGNVTLSATDTGLLVDNQTVVTSVDSSTLTLTGNITGGNINAVGGDFTGNVAIGNIFVGGYYWANGVIFAGGGGGGTPGGANTQIQFNDNGIFGGNAGLTFDKSINQVTATGNIQASYFLGNGSQLTGIEAGLSWTTQANTAPSSPAPGDFWYDSFADIKYQYTNDGTSNVWIDQSYPTSFSTLTVQNIVNGGANGAGNIGTSGGYFNTAFVKATSAQYADLAEIYEADQDYPPGTVVVFGGDKEVTVTDQSHDTRVAGVISTDPAFIMNSHAVGLPVAFTGRVPCRVQGPVTKGDVLVTSSIPGIAQKLGYNFQPGCVLGKSLKNISDNTIQTIEVVVGRF